MPWVLQSFYHTSGTSASTIGPYIHTRIQNNMKFQGAVYIYKQSDYFFSITETPGLEIPPGSPTPHDPYFMQAIDPRLTGKGRFDPNMHTVKLVKPTKFIEMLLQLWYHDFDLRGMLRTIYDSHWYVWLLYMADEQIRGQELLKEGERNPILSSSGEH
ncbi:hypothetical protein BBP40_010843 [Aspergillus hancockii]|nr:hypothetical protein BBP40_010843 [Aspergillus hancockii]